MKPTLLAAALLIPALAVAAPAPQLGGLFDGLFGDAEPVDAPIRGESGSLLRMESGSGVRVQSGSTVRVESGSVMRRGFDPPPTGAFDTPPASFAESGSGPRNIAPKPRGATPVSEEMLKEIRQDQLEYQIREREKREAIIERARRRNAESGSQLGKWEVGSSRSLEPLRTDPRSYSESGSGVATESGSGIFGGRPDPFGHPSYRPMDAGIIAPPPRPRVARPAPRDRASLGGGFDPNDLPPPSEAPPQGDARVHALLVSLGWIAALVAGGLGGYLLGLNRGSERRRRSLEPRQLDLAGEVAETADSLMAAADAEEAGRFEACVDRLRERVGRTAVLLDDRAAGAVRELVSAATTGPPSEKSVDRSARLQAAYDGLVSALRKSVRGSS
ncbi:hypothetical protein [Alienimonas chondri]|uniref:Transmembrane protein n=1 Tax=Alienimonas chondri TaxID=2681879 RepID=A0ABX1VIU7_9PLAN|nr:hypothetical protein [Alienimonas chondri]NNJ27765.1 hypothetical protein [Alienimonas chondri]